MALDYLSGFGPHFPATWAPTHVQHTQRGPPLLLGSPPRFGPAGFGVEPSLEGPPDANLFVLNLPVDLRDDGLFRMFEQFGVVLSAKVFVDAATNRSKGFGFVSFTDPFSAQMAIKAMDNAVVGTRRLKVQLKQRRA